MVDCFLQEKDGVLGVEKAPVVTISPEADFRDLPRQLLVLFNAYLVIGLMLLLNILEVLFFLSEQLLSFQRCLILSEMLLFWFFV